MVSQPATAVNDRIPRINHAPGRFTPSADRCGLPRHQLATALLPAEHRLHRCIAKPLLHLAELSAYGVTLISVLTTSPTPPRHCVFKSSPMSIRIAVVLYEPAFKTRQSHQASLGSPRLYAMARLAPPRSRRCSALL